MMLADAEHKNNTRPWRGDFARWRRLRTVVATSHGDGDFDFARWRQWRLRTVTMTVTSHSDDECWEVGTTKQW